MPKRALVFGYKRAGGAGEGITVAQAIGRGLEKHGFAIDDIRGKDIFWGAQRLVPNSHDYFLASVFGFREPLSIYCQRLNANGIPCLVGELGYLRRPEAMNVAGRYLKTYTGNDYYQVGLNKLCWLPPPGSCPGDRFEKLNLDRSDTRSEGQHVLVIGQTVGDAQHKYDMRAMIKWVLNTFKTLRQHTNRELVWRPHPKQEGSITGGPLFNPEGCDRRSYPSKIKLEEDFKNCHAVVTINSTAGNSALLRGIPVFCEPISIYAEVANTDLKEIETPRFFDTADYFNRLAYSQWTLAEMEAGEGAETWIKYCDEYRQAHPMAGPERH